MDTLHRTSRYQQLTTKLHRLATGETKDDGTSHEDIYTSILEEVNDIIESLRNRGDQYNSKAHFVILTVVMIVVLIWHSITTGGYIGDVIGLLLLGAFLFVVQYRMKQVITRSQNNVPKKLEGVQSKREFITLKMKYLDTAMDIKKARLLLVAIFYILFTPIMLVKLHEASLGSTPFDSTWVAYLTAYLVAGTLWFMYFNRSFEIYDDIENTMDYISDKLKVLT